MLTLLSPARDLNTGKAAIQAGADAVYIGASCFGARQAACNSLDDIRALADYARTYGVEILVTLNTLLSNEERKEAARMAWQLYEAGVSALIIQDLRLLNENLPPIHLHASTQCDNRTAEQAVRMQQLGFRRIVLARESGISDIERIRQATVAACREGQTPIELEAFVHGALCVSYSGRCYMSEVMMNRSANRGCCAQMCRQRYDLLDKNGNLVPDNNGKPISQRFVLSLQDMDRSRYLKQMVEAGVTTFKIEGRLKSADYVTNITAYYRQLLDRLFPKLTMPHQRYMYGFTPNPEKTFHRGATDYFLHHRTQPMACWDTPASTGEYIGTAVRHTARSVDIAIANSKEIHAGDGICYDNRGFAVSRTEGNTIYAHDDGTLVMPADGTRLYRNQDTHFLRSLTASRRIAVEITLQETESGFSLTMCNSTFSATIETETEKQPAIKEDRALATMREQIQKLGDTPFVAEKISLHTKPYFLPVKTLNQWRRMLTDKALQTLAVLNKPKANQHARVTTANLNPPQREKGNLMTCKYCILHELGHCRKTNPMSAEPTFLRLKNGKQMQLKFHCDTCEMEILEL